MKLIYTNDINIVKQCQTEFGCRLPSEMLDKRKDKFLCKPNNTL